MKLLSVVALGGALATSASGCGGKANSVDGGGGTATVQPADCVADAARCRTDGLREQCVAGVWATTASACTSVVSVDDQTGNYCATKADGSYRCWGKDAATTTALPGADYQRVQLTAAGLIGLKKDGDFVAAGTFQLPLGAPSSHDFDSTNMWGDQTLCFMDGERFTLVFDAQSGRMDHVLAHDGAFKLGKCAFEGLFCGLRADGTIWCGDGVPAPTATDWVDLTLSLGVLCGIKLSGQVECDVKPRYPAGQYSQIASTAAMVCTLGTDGALACVNLAGTTVLQNPGPFSALDAGLDVVCAVLATGTTLCYQQDPPGLHFDGPPIERLVAIAPTAEEDF